MPKKNAATPIRAAAKNATAPRPLAPVQQFIADEIADLLVNGGHNESIENLIWTACHHAAHRWLSNLYGPEETDKIEVHLKKFAQRDFENHKADLLTAIKQNRRATREERAEPKLAAERIRARVLDILRGHFDSFLVRATPEECWIMRDIMVTHESTTHGREEFNELPLAGAIEGVIEHSVSTYMRVPECMQKHVQNYIDALKAADVRDYNHKPAA